MPISWQQIRSRLDIEMVQPIFIKQQKQTLGRVETVNNTTMMQHFLKFMHDDTQSYQWSSKLWTKGVNLELKHHRIGTTAIQMEPKRQPQLPKWNPKWAKEDPKMKPFDLNIVWGRFGNPFWICLGKFVTKSMPKSMPKECRRVIHTYIKQCAKFSGHPIIYQWEANDIWQPAEPWLLRQV